MTSKEALEKISWSFPMWLLNKEIYEVIKRDLEVLEILKDNLTIRNEQLWLKHISIEDYLKVKEWLENDK